ncbi:MAG: hypothetical protein ACRD96_10640 [Bryobacteraceae bacterium]
MPIYQFFFIVFALSIPIIWLVVAARLIVCAYQALRASRVKFAVLSVLALVCFAGLLAAVVVVWFGYGIGHSKKDIWTELTVVGITGIPFYATSYGLWRLTRHFKSVLSRHAAGEGEA